MNLTTIIKEAENSFDEQFSNGDETWDITRMTYNKTKSFLTEQITKAVENERSAWLIGERCENCGNEMTPHPTSNTCASCWETI